ncbi:hypothetical protein LX36DRAFT_731649 [Colletotrichum falcatum]|nr:hypothetical protein LX36DRAFT_731649 [Colletotrichum falcatum]
MASSALSVHGPDDSATQEIQERAGPEHEIAKRGCYAFGVSWGHGVGLAIDAVEKACRDRFVGEYKGKTQRTACYNLDSGRRVNFFVRRWHDSPQTLTFDECKKYLRYEIVGCDKGGISYQGKWRFRSDPNSGSC